MLGPGSTISRGTCGFAEGHQTEGNDTGEGGSCLSCFSPFKKRGHLFVTLPIKPSLPFFLALISPTVLGTEVGRAALLDSDGREDKSKVGESPR